MQITYVMFKIIYSFDVADGIGSNMAISIIHNRC